MCPRNQKSHHLAPASVNWMLFLAIVLGVGGLATKLPVGAPSIIVKKALLLIFYMRGGSRQAGAHAVSRPGGPVIRAFTAMFGLRKTPEFIDRTAKPRSQLILFAPVLL